jgi:hypothetical protein
MVKVMKIKIKKRIKFDLTDFNYWPKYLELRIKRNELKQWPVKI